LSEYETIIFDTGGKLLDFMAGYIIKNNPKAGMRNGTLSLKGYGERKQEFSALCKRVSQLDKHIIFVAHQKTTEENEVKRYVPLFGGSNYDDLVTELDLVGYVKMIGNNRTITFNPTEKNDGKNTCNLPPEINIALSVDEKGNALKNEFFSQVIDAYTARIRKNQEEGIKYNNIIRTFAEGVEKATEVLRGKISESAYKDVKVFSKGLGGGYSEGQKKLCEITQKRLEKVLKDQKSSLAERVRMYRLLPVLIAASVIILLI
jgi:hypothetical protein